MTNFNTVNCRAYFTDVILRHYRHLCKSHASLDSNYWCFPYLFADFLQQVDFTCCHRHVHVLTGSGVLTAKYGGLGVRVDLHDVPHYSLWSTQMCFVLLTLFVGLAIDFLLNFLNLSFSENTPLSHAPVREFHRLKHNVHRAHQVGVHYVFSRDVYRIVFCRSYANSE